MSIKPFNTHLCNNNGEMVAFAPSDIKGKITICIQIGAHQNMGECEKNVFRPLGGGGRPVYTSHQQLSNNHRQLYLNEYEMVASFAHRYFLLFHVSIVCWIICHNLFAMALTPFADFIFRRKKSVFFFIFRFSFSFRSSTDSTDNGPVVDYTFQRCL